MATPEVEDVPITGETIRLGQLLKLAGVIEDGASARLLLADDVVQVNEEPETRRGRQVRPGDVLTVDLPAGPRQLRVVAANA